MRLTDKLEMVGVKLCDLWTTTRRINGESLKQKINNLMGSWRAGKFMPFILRPFSVNTYAFSKVWFRCCTVNLRESDLIAMNSSVKKWLYADLLLKPEELLLHRSVYHGGLGLSSIKWKSVAFLIRTFLELAANPKYLHSQYLNMLYRFHVLGENFVCPTLPPYYKGSFFEIICQAKNTGRDIISMTTRQWYIYLINKDVLKVFHEDGSESRRLCRAEVLSPDINWESIWGKVRHSSLSSVTSSFLWKLVNNLLTTEERVYSTIGNTTAFCRYCSNDVIANLKHCFFQCCLTKDVGSWLVALSREFGPYDEEKLLKLDVDNNDALMWISANVLHFCWLKRTSSKKAEVQECLAQLEADTSMMKIADFALLSQKISNILEQHNRY